MDSIRIRIYVYVCSGGLLLNRGKRDFYGPGDELWKMFLWTCKREGSSGSKKLTEFIKHYTEVHAPDNPQTLITRYTPNGSITHDNIERRVKQLVLEESTKGGRREIKNMRIIVLLKAEGIQGKPVVAMADHIAKWLEESMSVKVWR